MGKERAVRAFIIHPDPENFVVPQKKSGPIFSRKK